jgi:beta-lactamase regulating signal transducer with metallopeptidase domain/Tfp pilus assembly protein PilP
MNETVSSFLQAAWSQCWQVTALILLVGLVAWFLGNRRPHLVSVLWLVVILKCLMPPVWSSTSGVFCWLQASHNTAALHTSTPANLLPATIAPWQPLDPQAGAVRSPAAFLPSPIAPHPNPGLRHSWPSLLSVLLITAWSAGLLLHAWLLLVRWSGSWREIQAHQVPISAELAELLLRLQRELHVSRPVRLLITTSLHGPAVVGFWRPTIVLPQAIVAHQPLDNLKLLLAHELLHIRRGDLGLSLLQLVAQGLWWFHPLVQWANHRLTCETERSCDEEVIARMGCSPAAYARMLVHVLELKQQLHSVPAFPGVRPVDVTRQRLETIMKLGQGCRRSTPWWCWVVLAALALLLLPGAALLVPAKEKTVQHFGPRFESSGHLSAFMESTATSREPVGELKLKSYDVADPLTQVQTEGIVNNAEQGRLYLADMLRWLLPQGEQAAQSDAGQTLTWQGEQLTVQTTEAGHQRIAEQLTIFRETGFHQYSMEIRMIRAPAEFQSAFTATWEPLGAAPQDETFDTWLAAGKDQNRFETVVQRQPPAMLTVADDAQVKQFMTQCQSNPQVTILSCPKVTTYNGQSCRVESAVRRPFVVALREVKASPNEKHPETAVEPQIRVVDEGWKLRLRATGETTGNVKLNFALAQSEVRKVDVANYPLGNVQIPEVAESRIQAVSTIQPGQSVVLRGLESMNDKGEKAEPLWVMVRVVRIEEPLPPAKETPGTPKRVQPSPAVAAPQAGKATGSFPG